MIINTPQLQALRIAKTTTQTLLPMSLFYIGDPAIKLAIPKPKIRLTKVNDIPVSQAIEDLKSLARIKLSGDDERQRINKLQWRYCHCNI
jgi:hypothetical protein